MVGVEFSLVAEHIRTYAAQVGAVVRYQYQCEYEENTCLLPRKEFRPPTRRASTQTNKQIRRNECNNQSISDQE